MSVDSCSKGSNFSNSHFELEKKTFSEMKIDKNIYQNEKINDGKIKSIEYENMHSAFIQYVPLSEKSIALLDAIEQKNINEIRTIIKKSILDKPTLFRAYLRLIEKKQRGEIKISPSLIAAIYTKLKLEK